MSIQLGNMTITSGTDTLFQGAPNEGVKAILIGNESGLTCTITMEGGSVQKTLYPSTLDWFQVNRGFTGNIKIHPTSVLTNASTFPGTSLIFDAIGLNDSEQASMYPLSLVRNTNIGNTVATTGGSTTSVTNDNQALGTEFIESTPTGAASSTVAVFNDGTVTIKGDVANVLTTLLQLIPGAAAAASSVKLADSARQTEVLGTLLVDSTSTFTGAMHADGGINANTIRDDINGNSALDLSAGTGAVTFPQATTHTGDATFNGAGNGISVTHNALVSGNLAVTGSSSLDNGAITTDASGNVSKVGTVKFTSGNASLAISSGTVVLDATAGTDLTLNAPNTGSNHSLNFNVGGVTLGHFDDTDGELHLAHSLGLVVGTIGQLATFSGTGNQTVATGITNPTAIAFDPCTVSGSSQTIGGTTATSSVVTTGSGLAWKGTAWHA